MSKKYVIKHIPTGKYLWDEFEIGTILVKKMEDALYDDKSCVRYMCDDIEEMYVEDNDTGKVYKCQEITKADLEVYEVKVSVEVNKKINII